MADTDTILVPADLPMKPHDYVRRRRLLAGLTIADAARPFWHRPEHREDVERNLRGFEQPGAVMKPWVAASTRRAFDLDPEVYRALQEPPMFHPRLCRCCGSTEMEPRETRDGASATIVDDGICTACHEDGREQFGRRLAA